MSIETIIVSLITSGLGALISYFSSRNKSKSDLEALKISTNSKLEEIKTSHKLELEKLDKLHQQQLESKQQESEEKLKNEFFSNPEPFLKLLSTFGVDPAKEFQKSQKRRK